MEHPDTRPIVALVRDLFFTSRITPAIEALGRRAVVLSKAELLEPRCREDPPALVLIDIGAPRMDWAGAIGTLRANGALVGLPIVAFGPHRDLEARNRAIAAGCTEVVANSKLLLELPSIVRRHIQKS